MNLSKSQYIKYKGCPKHLWLYRNKKDVIALPDMATKQLLSQGNDIGTLAQKQFSNGVLVEGGWQNPHEAIKRTQKLMAQGVPAIYETAFCYNGILVFVDILEKTANGWNLIEVKSSGRTIKPLYLDDISIQYYVLKKCGVQIEHCYLMHINSDYFRTTDNIDWKQFFLFTLMDEELLAEQDIEKDLRDIKALLFSHEPSAILDKNGCAGCECYAYCWKDIPEGSVFELLRSNKARAYMEKGIVRVKDMPLNSLEDEKLKHWVEVYRTEQPYINKNAVKVWLDKLSYPLYYLDFETTMPVVPLWKYSRPYQQIPFQFSLHVQREPNGKLKHYEYLSTGKEDPRYGCVKALLEYIGNVGTIIAHNASFEKSRICEMAHDLPLPEKDAKDLLDMTKRFADTGDVFKTDYLHPKMHGSWSIKKVLPALVPEMSYEGMAVANGGDAMNAFDVLYAQEKSPDELEQLRKDLLKYCEQDTLAMVRIVDALRETIK